MRFDSATLTTNMIKLDLTSRIVVILVFKVSNVNTRFVRIVWVYSMLYGVSGSNPHIGTRFTSIRLFII